MRSWKNIAILRVAVKNSKYIEAHSKYYVNLQILYMYFYRGVCKKTFQNSIFRLMFYCHEF